MSSTDLLDHSVAILTRLGLHLVGQDWVDSVWDGQFTESPDLPLDYEEAIEGVEVGELLVGLQKTATSWLDIEQGSEADETSSTDLLYHKGFWTGLTERNIKYKVLIGLLFHYMERGQAIAAGAGERKLARRAASLYFVLLSLPGSGAFKIFHPVMFSKALETFKLVSRLGLFQKKATKKTQKSSQQKRTAGRATQSSQASQGSQEDENDEEGEGDNFSQQEVQSSIVGLEDVLRSLLLTLDHCSLKRSAESIEAVVTELVVLTHLETSFNLDLRAENQRTRPGDVSNLALLAYRALEKLCNPLHGEAGGGVLLVLKGLLPGLLMVGKGQESGGCETAGKRAAAVTVRGNCLKFVKYLVEKGDQSVQEAVCVLVQHMAVKVPDKADFRREAAEGIMDLMGDFPSVMFLKTVNWFIRYTHSEKSSNRLFSLEVLGRLMYAEDRDISEDNVEDEGVSPTTAEGQQEYEETVENQSDPHSTETVENGPQDGPLRSKKKSSPVFSRSLLFACIYGRCGDVSAMVRTQALKTIGEITEDQTGGVKEVLDTIFAPGKACKDPELVLTDLIEDDDLGDTHAALLPSGEELVSFLRRRALDQSVFVRKSALQVLENILRSSEGRLAGDLVEVLAEHCRDSSLAVRKQMVISLTELVKTYNDKEDLVMVWVKGVFPLILDVEAKASEKVLECIWECLFGNLVPSSRAGSGAAHALPWLILSSVERSRMTNYLARACNVWAKEGLLTSGVLAALQSYTGTERNGPAWMLLGLISAHVPCKDPQSVMEYFSRYIQEPEGVGLYTLLQVLKVLFASVAKLSPTDRTALQTLLLDLVRQFKIPPELISVAVDVITVVSGLDWPPDKNTKQYQSAVDGWAVQIIESIDTHLSAVFLSSTSERVDERLLMRQIFTLGELCQICPHRINKRLYLLMQSIVYQEAGEVDITGLEAPELPSTQTQSTQPPVCRFVPTSRLQALTIVSLGKMCLQNEPQAKKIIPAFGKILETTSDSSIKNNIMYALTDMCVRYASLVDPLLHQMTTCLRDRAVSVRRTTLILLIHLLQEDYLKIRGNGRFFFRVLQAYQDPSEEIRHLTTFYIQQRLLKRIPKIMYSHFVEALFHFNDYTSHASYNKFSVSDKEKRMFDLSGITNVTARQELYCFMLSSMNDEERFQTTFRLSKDILGGVVEGTVSLGPDSLHLLQDTFFCLASDQIKLQSLKTKSGAEDEPENEQDMAGKVLEAAKKTVISGTVKKNVIENIIPTVIALKHKLEASKSPLISDLFSYLRRLMEDYKTEVADILAADKQLAKEIEFELRRFDQEQQEKQEREEQERARHEQDRRAARLSGVSSPRPPLASPSARGTPSRKSLGGGGSSLLKLAFQKGLEQTPKKNQTPRKGQTPKKGDVRKSLASKGEMSAESVVAHGGEVGERVEKRVDHLENEGEHVEEELEKVENEAEGVEKESEKIVEEGEQVEKIGANDKQGKKNEVDGTEAAEKGNNEIEATNQPGTETSSMAVQGGVTIEVNNLESVVSDNVTGSDISTATNAKNSRKSRKSITTDKTSVEAAKRSTRKSTVEAETPSVKDNKNPSKNKTPVNGIIDTSATEAEDPNITGIETLSPEQETPKQTSNETSAEKVVPSTEDVFETPTTGTETPNDNCVETPSIEADDAETNKSKRVSGQGMERMKQPKTPQTRITHNRRAISTPQINKTVLAGNVTFLGESVLDISSITVLSPPSSVADPDSRRGSSDSKPKDDSDAVSFKFRKGGKDMFDQLCGSQEGNKGKRKPSEERKEDSKRLTRTRSSDGGRSSKRGSLNSIEEEGGAE